MTSTYRLRLVVDGQLLNLRSEATNDEEAESITQGLIDDIRNAGIGEFLDIAPATRLRADRISGVIVEAVSEDEQKLGSW